MWESSHSWWWELVSVLGYAPLVHSIVLFWKSVIHGPVQKVSFLILSVAVCMFGLGLFWLSGLFLSVCKEI